jgi:hypothetical protein
MSIWLLVAMWCIAQPVPFCVRMEIPDLTLGQCYRAKPLAINRAMQEGAFEFDAYCVVGTSYPT